MPIIDERITKLPKWAHEHIKSLMRQLAAAEQVAEQARNEGQTRVQVNPKGFTAAADYNAPDYSEVRFQMGDHWDEHLDVRIEKWHDGDVLQIRGGTTGIEVRPHAGNVVHIKLRR